MAFAGIGAERRPRQCWPWPFLPLDDWSRLKLTDWKRTLPCHRVCLPSARGRSADKQATYSSLMLAALMRSPMDFDSASRKASNSACVEVTGRLPLSSSRAGTSGSFEISVTLA
jgi:hypothetical protein